jgi:hypothetical protein
LRKTQKQFGGNRKSLRFVLFFFLETFGSFWEIFLGQAWFGGDCFFQKGLRMRIDEEKKKKRRRKSDDDLKMRWKFAFATWTQER